LSSYNDTNQAKLEICNLTQRMTLTNATCARLLTPSLNGARGASRQHGLVKKNGVEVYLSPMFSIGRGFKTTESHKVKGVPINPWSEYGAQWNKSGKVRIAPDAEANRMIGSALNELRKPLMSLAPPSAIKIPYADWVNQER
jgi:hypothetical protein